MGQHLTHVGSNDRHAQTVLPGCDTCQALPSNSGKVDRPLPARYADHMTSTERLRLVQRADRKYRLAVRALHLARSEFVDAVDAAVADPEAGLSQRKIAVMLGKTHAAVGQMRHEEYRRRAEAKDAEAVAG